MKQSIKKIWIFNRGSLSIEAALVMPIFMFSMICVISLSTLLLFQIRIKEALHEEIKKAEYLSVYEGIPSVDEISRNVLSDIGEYILNIAPIEGGATGIDFRMERSGEIISICANYEAKLYYDLLGIFNHSFTQKCLQHDFNGYERGLAGSIGLDEEIYVYVTRESEVYHVDRECSHIRLRINEISGDELDAARNDSGGIYKSCDKCHSRKTDARLYISPDGDKYHNSLGCSGLRRTVNAIPLSEVGERRPCSRCGR